ncbi:MAG: hypothetical protein WBB01_11310 [Phormidesmis sp.]
MARSSIRYRIALLGTTIVSGAQLSTARQAIAHADHFETEDPSPLPHSEQPRPLPEPSATEAATQKMAPTNKLDSEADALPTARTNRLEDETAIQTVPATQKSVATSRSGLLDGLSIGLGESLLAFIISGPFLLRFWKKRSQS